MASKKGASRRDYLKIMAVAAGGIASGAGSAALVGRMGPSPAGPWRVLTEDEARLVDAISEQIIPSDQDAGAREAGVVHFIDQQLDGPYSKDLASYRKGLNYLQQYCLKQHSKPFEQLGWSEQTRVLESVESGKVPKEIWQEGSSRNFFNLIREHTMQGFYGSPRHGGNRNYVSYRMMGLEYPRLIGQNRYKNNV